MKIRLLGFWVIVAILSMQACGGSGGGSSSSSSSSSTSSGTATSALTLTKDVTTLVGSNQPYSGSADGTGTVATFSSPKNVVLDSAGYAYVSDTGNHTIRKIVVSTGVVTTLAGTAGTSGSTNSIGAAASFKSPSGIASESAGTNLYVADTGNHTIRKIVVSSGTVTTLAGTAGTSGSADGTGTAATLKSPSGIATDSTGTNLYVSDTGNHTIRKIVVTTGVVTTVAGTAGTSGTADGTGTAATFKSPSGIAADSTGTNLYVADTGNHTIRKIVVASRVVTTVAGIAGTSGTTDSAGASTLFNSPEGVAIDPTSTSNLIVADTSNSCIRKVTVSTGGVSSVAGAINGAGSTDASGTNARFSSPVGIATNGTDLFVTDSGNNTIRKIVVSTGAVTTLAGTAGSSGSVDGSAVSARFNNPTGIVSDGTNLYVSDTGNHTIRKVVIATGDVTLLAGSPGNSGTLDGVSSAARFKSPGSLMIINTDLYVADTGNHTIRKVVIATGEVITLVGSYGVSGSLDGTNVTARFNSPQGLTTDKTNIYVVDSGNNTIRKVVLTSVDVTTLAGAADATAASTDSTGAAARFNSPYGITNDGTYLYISDYGNSSIRRLTIATNEVTTIAGSSGSVGSTNSNGAGARFNGPTGITSLGGKLYVVDTGNNMIRKII